MSFVLLAPSNNNLRSLESSDAIFLIWIIHVNEYEFHRAVYGISSYTPGLSDQVPMSFRTSMKFLFIFSGTSLKKANTILYF